VSATWVIIIRGETTLINEIAPKIGEIEGEITAIYMKNMIIRFFCVLKGKTSHYSYLSKL
ncbi:hypothetical protein, partial [Pseudomonas sp. 2822-17]|uniref:hypothetical protein n=1 Tax=Pseudomonas sp. 2822-17 TaxID=1712678 RepID=UPI001C48C61B